MIEVTKEESERLRRMFPEMCYARTKHRRYFEEHPTAMKYLRKWRRRHVK